LVGAERTRLLGDGGISEDEVAGIGRQACALTGLGLVGAGIARELSDGTRSWGAMPGIRGYACGLFRQRLIAAVGTRHTRSGLEVLAGMAVGLLGGSSP
jgi:hypothetical protein